MMRRLPAAGSLSLALTGLFLAASGGCGPAAPPPWSPTPEQDPARYDQARRAEDHAKRRNQEAEKILMKKRHVTLPRK
jgi:hypothetical protein